jgi:hypothetical protein
MVKFIYALQYSEISAPVKVPTTSIQKFARVKTSIHVIRQCHNE